MERFTITFLPDNKKIEVNRGREILSAAVAAGVYINSSCGGDGICGRCKVIVRNGLVHTEPTGRISQEERERGYYLACLTTVHSDIEVEIPQESRLDMELDSDEKKKFLRLSGIFSTPEEIDQVKPVIEESIFSHSPLATKLYIDIPPPNLKDNISDLERLYREIRKVKDIPIMQTGLSNIKRLGNLLRESNWKVTTLLGNRNGTTEIVLIEPGDVSQRNFGMVFDIGTTTISAQLVDLNRKKILGTKATYNTQAAFGSDVITRIVFATEKDGLERLHHAVVDTMNTLTENLISEHGINLNEVNGVMCAGNMTMIHILLRVDPTYIRKEPYTPTANFVPVIRAAEAGIKVNPRGLLACVPGVSSYVGGDTTAGVLASGIYKSEEIAMLIDIGTNGEIAVGNRDWIACCAASAGPAFEGSGVSCGMRASRGAIQKIKIVSDDMKVSYQTIGDAPPRGICGSGMIDSIAELLNHRIIDRNGKIDSGIKSPRVRQGAGGMEFVLSFKEESDTGHDIVLTEADIDNLKRSKGAIYAATAMLLKRMGLGFDDVKQFYVSGGFGTYLDMEKAIRIGLLPDIDREKFKFIGNSSLAGARETIFSYEAELQAEEIARKMTYLELSVEPLYMEEYISSLFFPHTDEKRFPTVWKMKG
ncbi:MAG: DUF4445 domain-containing protein [Candidatus Omnitrophica bacterium]|nr:DUF4445 domain-containing protein [Candidatus Omnitrophota bacterium]